MNKINKLFLIFKDRESFEHALGDEAIKNTSIAFIAKERLIWTLGIMFGGESTHAKGFFNSVNDLPNGEEGDWAIVNEDGTWYVYYFRDGRWNKGDEYDTSLSSDILNNYVKKDNLLNYIKNFYDNVYVRKDEVYTPDQWESGEYEPSQGGTLTPGSSYSVDDEINKDSFNPVANYVIYNALQALKNELQGQIPEGCMTQAEFELAALNYITINTLSNYYTKLEVGNTFAQFAQKSEVYTKEETYSKERIDNMLSIIPTFEIQVVSELPENPSRSVMYLVQDDSEDSLYTSYIYDGQWKQLGQQSVNVDLSNYPTRSEVLTSLSTLQTNVDASLSNTSMLLNTQLQNTNSRFDQYYTKTQSEDKFVDEEDVYYGNEMLTPSTVLVDTAGYNPYNNYPQDTDTYATWNRVSSFVESKLNTELGNISQPNNIIIDQASYDALLSYEPNTLYFVTENQEESFEFGGTFPIILS